MIRIAFLCLFLWHALYITTSSAQGFKRATYGESCNRTHRCDAKQSLTCNQGTCDCLMSTMIYDEDQGKCVAMSGEKCVYTAVELSEASSEEREKKTWRENLDCVSNANCLSDFCVCTPGYFETINGTCERKHNYNGSCITIEQCQENNHLICNPSGLCDCNKKTVFDVEKQKCVGRVGSLCKDLTECVANAQCPPKPQEIYYDSKYYSHRRPLTRDLEYSSETCACKPGFSNDPILPYCLAQYGENCDSHLTYMRCLPGLLCLNGKCSCIYNNHQYYDRSQEKCLTLVGGPCSSNDTCVENSECVGETRSGSFTGICECKEGLIEVNRRCEVAFKQKCGNSVFPKASCDSIAPLQCIDGTCQCQELEFYDDELKLCRGLEGSICSLESEKSYFCVEGSICVPFRNKTSGIGRCLCMDGYLSMEDRKCKLIQKTTFKIQEITTPSVLSALQLDSETSILQADQPMNETSNNHKELKTEQTTKMDLLEENLIGDNDSVEGSYETL